MRLNTYLLQLQPAILCVLLASLSATAAANPWVDAAPQVLSEYLRINTINPPGNEIDGARFIARIFDAHDIDYEIAESAPGRGNIWARLEGGDKPALVLLNHIDVVPADARFWSTEPLSGAIRDGYVWGRGALDMKGLGIVQLQAFLALHASGKRLNRDVIFMATADEEAGGYFGAGWLAKQRPELFEGVGYLLNEGGGGGLYGDEVVFTVEVTQKVPLWIRLTARGNPGHGSAPQIATAVTRLLRAGNRIAETQFEARAIPAVAQMFEGLAPYQDDKLGAQYGNIAGALGDTEFMSYLQLTNPRHHALLRNTCSITRLSGSDKINVVPAEATLELDCRLLPDQEVEAFEAELLTITADTDIDLERLMAFTPAVSPSETPLFQLIAELAAKRHAGSRVVPGVSTGFTDSHFFRDLGITSYGFSPVVLNGSEARGVHGNNERIPVDALKEGVAFQIELLKRFTTRR